MALRNWLGTLFAASYKGVPFFVETDTQEGRRRIVEHEAPMRDDPFLEDLGEGVRHYSVTAYVASNAADTEGERVLAICAQRGPGILVLPTLAAPVLARCLTFERTHAKDKLGYAALSLRFAREGASGAIATVNSLANLLFVAADGAAAAVASNFANRVQMVDVPDYVSDTAVSGVQTALSAFEAIRTSRVVDDAVTATQRDAITATFGTVDNAIASEDVATVQDMATSVVAIGRGIADGMDADQAMPAFEEIITSFPADAPVVITGSIWRVSVAKNEFVSTTLLRITALIAYCEAIGRLDLKDRPTGISIRANVAEYFEQQLLALPSEDFELYQATLKLRDATVEYLSRAITNLAPVIRISANMRMPSLYWSWRIYADPTRGSELVDRNKVVHPSFMPTHFEALSR